MKFGDYEGCWFLPFLWPFGGYLYNEVEWDMEEDAYVDHQKAKMNFTNLTNHNKWCDEMACEKPISLFLRSNRLHDHIGAKRKVTDVSDASMMAIMEGDPDHSSKGFINELMNNGVKFLFMAGEGDFMVPWNGMEVSLNQCDKVKKTG